MVGEATPLVPVDAWLGERLAACFSSQPRLAQARVAHDGNDLSGASADVGDRLAQMFRFAHAAHHVPTDSFDPAELAGLSLGLEHAVGGDQVLFALDLDTAEALELEEGRNQLVRLLADLDGARLGSLLHACG